MTKLTANLKMTSIWDDFPESRNKEFEIKRILSAIEIYFRTFIFYKAFSYTPLCKKNPNLLGNLMKMGGFADSGYAR